MKQNRIQQQEDGRVRVIRFVRGRGNALDEATLHELAEVFRRIQEPQPLVLAGTGSSFCTGLDLLECFERDRDGMARTMEAFHRALCACFLHPGPVVAALGGNALAGGALLAMACDRRWMAEGSGRFGIHGVHLGVSYPQVALEILRYQLPRRTLEDLLYAGHIYAPQDAREAGLIDRVVDPGALEGEAILEAKRFAEGGLESFGEAKRALRARAASRLEPIQQPIAESWLDQWFRPETRLRVGRARDALGGAGGAKPGA